MDESQNHYVERNKPDTKYYILPDSVYVKSLKGKAVVTEAELWLPWIECGEGNLCKGAREIFLE